MLHERPLWSEIIGEDSLAFEPRLILRTIEHNLAVNAR